MKVSEEVKDRKNREKNIVIKGWSTVETSGWKEQEKNEARKWGQAVVSNYVKSTIEIEEAEWYGKEERKVLVVKMKSREDKSEVLKKRGNLKGTRIYLEDDLTGEERKKQQQLLKLRRMMKEVNKETEIWVRNGAIRVNGVWHRADEAK